MGLRQHGPQRRLRFAGAREPSRARGAGERSRLVEGGQRQGKHPLRQRFSETVAKAANGDASRTAAGEGFGHRRRALHALIQLFI